MTLIGPSRTTVECCPTCGFDVRDGKHATSSHQNDATVEVEYVRADLHEGAVSALEAIRDYKDDWGPPPDDAMRQIAADALKALGRQSTVTVYRDPEQYEAAVERGRAEAKQEFIHVMRDLYTELTSFVSIAKARRLVRQWLETNDG